MALTVATGFVVDDAIVVLENISRHIETRHGADAGGAPGAREVGFTVMSMSLSLIAVFIPILFMGGIVGRLFREFAVTLSVAILVSLVVSLTTTPMMCARLLRAERHASARAPVPRERAGVRAAAARLRAHARLGAAPRPLIVMLLLAARSASTSTCTSSIPKGFFPQQDTGRLIGFIRADQSISFQAMQQKIARLRRHRARGPGGRERDRASPAAAAGATRGFDVRRAQAARRAQSSADEVVARLRAQAREGSRARTCSCVPVQDMRVGGRQAQRALSVHAAGRRPRDAAHLERRALQRRAASVPELADVNSDQETRGLQTALVDRPRRPPRGSASRTRHDRRDAQRRIRPAPGLDHLHRAATSTAWSWRSRRNTRRARGAEGRLRARAGRRAGAARRRSPLRVHEHAALGEPPGPVRRHHHLLQPAARRRRCREATRAINDAMARIGVPDDDPAAASRAPRARSSHRSRASPG